MIWAAELQRALYDRLAGNLPAPVWNHMPQGVRPPYVVIGNQFTELPGPLYLHDAGGSEMTVLVHVWDNARGTIRLARIMADVDRLLDTVALDLDGVAVAKIQRHPNAPSQLIPEQPDDSAELWYHGAMRYIAWIHGASRGSTEVTQHQFA